MVDIRKHHRQHVFENKVLMLIFGPKKEAGGKFIMMIFIIYVLQVVSKGIICVWQAVSLEQRKMNTMPENRRCFEEKDYMKT
jgi:hypothetical protein